MATKTKIGAGNVEIDIAGNIYTLRPTLKAAQGVSRRFDGITGAYARIAAGDLDAITAIVNFGLGYEGKDATRMESEVFEAGITDMIAPVSRFISVLANGGRPPVEGGEEDSDPPNA